MHALERSNQGGENDRTPDNLRSHPVNTTRIAEAKQRAAKMENGDTRFTPAFTVSDNPLLPSSLQISTAPSGSDSVQFGWVRERLRVLSANTPTAAVNEYGRMRRAGKLSAAQRYGLAYAHLLAGHGDDAVNELEPLLDQYPGDTWLLLAMGQAQARAGNPAAADAVFEDMLARMPRNRAVALTYAGVLAERNNAAAGKRAQDVLRPLLASAGDDPLFQSTFARVNEIAGDPIRAGEAWAEAAYLNGRPERALVQLNNLKKRSDLDYYARARIDARIAAITPAVLELRRQGVRDPDLDRR
jgi:predicted Zn-dependent protease